MQVNRNLKIKEKHLFLVIIITSFLVSLSFLWGNIDPDFFSFYYIGRGVAQGKDMYVDFADNKGPVLYFFFSVLYLFFKNNYKLALIVTSTILDTFFSFFFYYPSYQKLLDRDIYRRRILRNRGFFLYTFIAFVSRKKKSLFCWNSLLFGNTYQTDDYFLGNCSLGLVFK